MPSDPNDHLDRVLTGVVAEGERRIRHRRRLRRSAAATVALAALATAALVAQPVDRRLDGELTGSNDGGPPVPDTSTTSTSVTAPTATTGPPPAPSAANLVPPSSPAAFLARVKREALAAVTAHGLPSFMGAGGPSADMMLPAPVAARTAGASESRASAGGGGAAGPASPPASSGTNNQEAGVDEADSTKTDGRLLVTIVGDVVNVVDVRGDAKLVGTIRLPGGHQPGSLFLTGDKAVVTSTSYTGGGPGVPALPRSGAHVVDLSDPAKPTIVRSHLLDGGLVSARLVDGKVRVVLGHAPVIQWAYPTDETEAAAQRALEENRRRIRTSTVQQWLAPGTGCADGYTTPVDSGLHTVAVRTIDPAASAPGPGVCVVGGAQTVYASVDSLYVGTSTLETVRAQAAGRPAVPGATTAIHRFDLSDPDRPRYAGSDEVEGTLLNQFSLSEHGGHLRVATNRLAGGAGVDSVVTVLRADADRLVPVGRLDGLGRGERITGVRFVGDMGYIVTSTVQMCDPLIVVDLRQPSRPALRGELKVPGISSYLHPTSPGRLLSLGRDNPGSDEATTTCQLTSPALSLFDVSNPDRPTRLHQSILGRGWSPAENDHHAFLYWPATRLLVIPVVLHEEGFSGAIGFLVDDRGFHQLGRISHPASNRDHARQVTRSYVVGDRLLTVSAAGVATNDVRTLAPRGFAAF